MASRLGLRCIGYEVDGKLFKLSRDKVEAEGLADRVEVYN